MTTAHVILETKSARNKRTVVDTSPREYAGAYVRASTEAAAEKTKSCIVVGMFQCVYAPIGFERLVKVCRVSDTTVADDPKVDELQ